VGGSVGDLISPDIPKSFLVCFIQFRNRSLGVRGGGAVLFCSVLFCSVFFFLGCGSGSVPFPEVDEYFVAATGGLNEHGCIRRAF
jgi:hypothetical protein